MGEGNHEFGLISSPLQIEDAASMLQASWIDFPVESHEQEVCQDSDHSVVQCCVKPQLGCIVEGECHDDVSRVDVLVVVVKLKVSQHSLLEVGISFFELDEQHVAIVGCDGPHTLVVCSIPCALRVDVVEDFVKVDVDCYVVFVHD